LTYDGNKESLVNFMPDEILEDNNVIYEQYETYAQPYLELPTYLPPPAVKEVVEPEESPCVIIIDI